VKYNYLYIFILRHLKEKKRETKYFNIISNKANNYLYRTMQFYFPVQCNTLSPMVQQMNVILLSGSLSLSISPSLSAESINTEREREREREQSSAQHPQMKKGDDRERGGGGRERELTPIR